MECSFPKLNQLVTECKRCPRLVLFRETSPVRAAFKDQPYWRKPVPGFGDPQSWLLILGLAPSAQGGNRTGRIFTGDESARFLLKGLFEAKLANHPYSESFDDGLILHGCYMTASVKCVPPENTPSREEFLRCSCYFENEFFLLKNLKAVLALGKSAFETYLSFVKKHVIFKSSSFGHGEKISIEGWPSLYGSYHPSPQNTNTKKLTMEMFLELLNTIKKENKP